MRAPIDWTIVEHIMQKTVRGHGYAPTREEMRLMERALRSDRARYSVLHRIVKDLAVAEVSLNMGVKG